MQLIIHGKGDFAGVNKLRILNEKITLDFSGWPSIITSLVRGEKQKSQSLSIVQIFGNGSRGQREREILKFEDAVLLALKMEE